jgi:outer membrane protein assembly factor BamB
MINHFINHASVSQSTVPYTAYVKWIFPAGGGIVGPVVADGMVFFGSGYNVYALNETNNGVKIWNYSTPTVIDDSPAVADGMVFFVSDNGVLYALNETSNLLNWSRSIGSAPYSNPAVADGMVFIGSNNNNVYALNETTGVINWTYTTGGPTYNSPAVADGMVFIGSYDKNFYALNETNNGVKIWNYTTGYVIQNEGAAVSDNLVFFGSNDKIFYALNETTGLKVWNYTTTGIIEGTPAIDNGMVFFGDGNNYTYALYENGSFAWNYTNGTVMYNPSIARGMVFFGSDNGVYALNETTGALVWNYSSGGSVQGGIAIADGMLFVGSTNGNIYAFSQPLPIINLVSPANNTYSNLTSQTFTFNYSSPVSSTANCSLFINGVLNQSNSTTLNNTNTNLTVNGLNEGTYNWSVGCTDLYKNSNSSGNQTLTIITTPPAVNPVKPANNTYSSSSSVTVVFNYTSALSPTANCSFFVLIGGVWQLLSSNSTTLNNTNTTIYSSSNVGVGVYPWVVNCTDLAGNENSSGVSIFTVIAPINVSLVSPANNSALQYPQPFEFNVTGSSSTYDCNLYLNNTPYGQNPSVPNNTNTNISSNQSLFNGFYYWFVNCSVVGGSGVSQIFYLNFSGIFHNLILMNIIPQPNLNKVVYNSKDNVSFSLDVFNSGSVPDTANANISTSNGGVFNCPSTPVNAYSDAIIPCTGNVTMNVSTVVVNASIQPVPGEVNGVYNKTITLYSNAVINSKVNVPDDNLIVIIAFSFLGFYVFRNRLKKR